LRRGLLTAACAFLVLVLAAALTGGLSAHHWVSNGHTYASFDVHWDWIGLGLGAFLLVLLYFALRPAQRLCPNCGEPLTASPRRCPHCGVRFPLQKPLRAGRLLAN
jgi:hypothetical protein